MPKKTGSHQAKLVRRLAALEKTFDKHDLQLEKQSDYIYLAGLQMQTMAGLPKIRFDISVPPQYVIPKRTKSGRFTVAKMKGSEITGNFFGMGKPVTVVAGPRRPRQGTERLIQVNEGKSDIDPKFKDSLLMWSTDENFQ